MNYRLAGHSQRHPKRWLMMAGIVLSAALLCGGALFVFTNHHRSAPPVQVSPKATSAQPASDVSLATNMLFVGDVFWGRTVQTKAEASPLHYTYPTSGLQRADRDAYDAWIGNFECPITTDSKPLKDQIASLSFNCRPEYLPNLAKWFTIGGQANNHTMNEHGQPGVEQTRQNLEANGIQYFGNYDMTRLNDICEVVEMPAHVQRSSQKVSMPVALCGYMQVVDAIPTAAQLDVMKAYAKVMPVIAMPHMGVEYRATAEPTKVRTYRAMIDSGADIVIAAHPHVIQNSEAYHGRLIAYSLGNFLFDQQSVSRDTTLGLAVGIRLTVHDPKAAAIYEQVAPSCKVYKDSCLRTLETKITKRPSIDVAYTFSCFDESVQVGRVPHKGTEPVCNEARQKATVDQLQGLTSQW